MADRYRFPGQLGGGEYDALTGFSVAGDDTRMRFCIPDVGVVDVPEAALTKVEPPLPPEPPDRTIVAVGTVGRALYERNDVPDIRQWQGLHDKAWYTWAEVCEDGTPVRLVPDPAAGVELPWSGQSRYMHTMRVESEGDGSVVIEAETSSSGIALNRLLSPEVARAMAAALLAAADAAEAGAP